MYCGFAADSRGGAAHHCPKASVLNFLSLLASCHSMVVIVKLVFIDLLGPAIQLGNPGWQDSRGVIQERHQDKRQLVTGSSAAAI